MADTRRTSTTSENVRMGPVALFTLLTVISLAVLAVLAISTSNATLALAQRRADATTQLYLDETAAQGFYAALDEQLAGGAAPDEALAQARETALQCVTPQLEQTGLTLAIDATREDDTYKASFDCGNGRQLNVTLRYGTDGVLHVDLWRMTSVVNDEPAIGNLFGSS